MYASVQCELTTSRTLLIFLENPEILGVDRDRWEFYLMFLSREIEIKLCEIYTKIYIYTILYKNSRFKRIIFSKYITNLETTISPRSLRNLGLFLFLFEFNNFSFFLDIIDNCMAPPPSACPPMGGGHAGGGAHFILHLEICWKKTTDSWFWRQYF